MNKRIKELAEQAGLGIIFHLEDMGVDGEAELWKFAELIVRQCGYYADVFEALGCPVHMDPTETKPSDYIKKQLEIENEKV